MTATGADPAELLDAALAYAALNLPVVDLAPGERAPRRGIAWRGVPALDTTEIDRRWTECPTGNVAIATGRAGLGLVAVEVDGESGGAEAWWRIAGGGAVAPTLTIRHTGGWTHLFQAEAGRVVPCSVDVLGAGITVAAEGAFTIAPPSRVDGGAYTWANLTDIAPWPTWLADVHDDLRAAL